VGTVQIQVQVRMTEERLAGRLQQQMHHHYAFSQTAHTAVQRCLADR